MEIQKSKSTWTRAELESHNDRWLIYLSSSEIDELENASNYLLSLEKSDAEIK